MLSWPSWWTLGRWRLVLQPFWIFVIGHIVPPAMIVHGGDDAREVVGVVATGKLGHNQHRQRLVIDAATIQHIEKVELWRDLAPVGRIPLEAQLNLSVGDKPLHQIR